MERTRTHPLAIIRYGLYLYFRSRSFRLTAECLLFLLCCDTKDTCIHLEIDGFKKKYSSLADGFRVHRRRLVKRIFVDKETLIQIDCHDYWLRSTAYEPNLNACLMMVCIYLGKEDDFSSYVISSSSNNYILGLIKSPFLQMVLYGTMKPANG
jgi:hypothetical protein